MNLKFDLLATITSQNIYTHRIIEEDAKEYHPLARFGLFCFFFFVLLAVNTVWSLLFAFFFFFRLFSVVGVLQSASYWSFSLINIIHREMDTTFIAYAMHFTYKFNFTYAGELNDNPKKCDIDDGWLNIEHWLFTLLIFCGGATSAHYIAPTNLNYIYIYAITTTPTTPIYHHPFLFLFYFSFVLPSTIKWPYFTNYHFCCYCCSTIAATVIYMYTGLGFWNSFSFYVQSEEDTWCLRYKRSSGYS